MREENMNEDQRQQAVLDYVRTLKKGDTILVNRDGTEVEKLIHIIDLDDSMLPVAIGYSSDWAWLESKYVVLPREEGKALKDIQTGSLIRLDSGTDESSVTGTVVSVDSANDAISLTFGSGMPLRFIVADEDTITVLKESPNAVVTISVGALETTLGQLLYDDEKVKEFVQAILRESNK